MKIFSFLIIAVFAFSPYFVSESNDLLYPKYSIKVVYTTDVRVIKRGVTGITVEHFTSYIDENEYLLKIEVIQNKDTEVKDSVLVLECFYSEKLARRIFVDINDVEWTSDRSFTYSFPLVVEQSGWMYFCISTPSEIEQQSQQERYRHITTQVIYLNVLRH